ncbi:hypothetical protein ALC60_01810 [Trachymyrmex zeteki]|uniref:Uncharacterized protein n=1 Tax=Mycetomoellerius zeteki TaxID=64791 RepID=A0A151XFQ6_9HYME|nr:hypothetical protein ALC60_01810 [Trachymyrmex zeteki]
MVFREVAISTFCSTLAFVPAENRTMIQNVGGVGRKGRLSVYHARMAALTQRYRAYVRDLATDSVWHFVLHAKRRSVGRGNPTLPRRTERRECVESICHGAGYVDTNRQEGSGKKYSHFPRSSERRRQGLAMGSGREMEMGAHGEGNGRGARTKGSKILIGKEGGTQLRQQMFNRRLTTRSATDYITANDNQFSNTTPNTRLRYTSLKKKKTSLPDKADDNNRVIYILLLTNTMLVAMEEVTGELRLPGVYAKRKLVEHTNT